MSSLDENLVRSTLALLGDLQAADYRFITPGVGTIGYNRRRRAERTPTLADLFGWNLEFDPGKVEAPQFPRWATGGLFDQGRLWKSRLRVSWLRGRLYAHSSFPTTARDTVFLGPDSYRFARIIAQQALDLRPDRILDMGCGAGVGALVAADLWPHAEVIARDVNPAALELTRINAAAAGCKVRLSLGGDLPMDLGPFDLIIANPPFIADPAARIYRDGGGMLGLETTMRWADQAVQALSPNGALLVYAATPIEEAGADLLHAHLLHSFPADAWRLDYDEVDPDVFPGLLGKGAYAASERIAAVSFTLRRR